VDTSALYTVRQSFQHFSTLLMDRTGQFTDNKSAAFPYSLAAKDDQEIFDARCVPEDFVLSDPDHLPGAQITSLYLHWVARQRRKVPAFVVLKPGPLHQAAPKKSMKAKGKRKMEYVEVDSDDEEVKSAGEKDEQEQEEQRLDQDDIAPRMKFGPPKKLGTNVAGPSKQLSNREDNIRKAATSSLPPKKGARLVTRPQMMTVEMTVKNDRPREGAPDERPKTRPPAKNAQSKKRKAEEDLQPEPPKALKTGRDAKSARETDNVPVAKPLMVSDRHHAPNLGRRLIHVA
jgi:hypothetical protein